MEGEQLKILNSFTRRKDPLILNEPKLLKWYSCGPTVYDVSHLGHARCYITFDIIRRILTNYFGYQVFYVMNITDIDDKIIKRARSNYLCDKFIDEALQNNAFGNPDNRVKLMDDLRRILERYRNRRKGEQDTAKQEMIKNILNNSQNELDAIEKILKAAQIDAKQLRLSLGKLRDIIADEQDTLLAHTVTDHQIFKTLTSRFEQEFHDDMERLDVLPPNALTRVSEYIEEIGNYIKKLEENGFAYRADGSVYFDTEKFDSDPKHSYAKLVREAYGQKKDLDEGEGELSTNQDGKRSPNDFALWKKSKVGEPSWETQDFEAGRPGWHIECSVMASHLLGENFDIHSGGSDLKFPHHDNEIAQAEAYYNTGKNWVNYFIHSGHLTISGCKMSKSLKNFITIRQALQDYSSRQLRFAFLAHGWAETLDYSDNTMNTAMSYEKTFREFLLNVAESLRRLRSSQGDQTSNSRRSYESFKKWSDKDHELNKEFNSTIVSVHKALCNNFDTRSTLNALSGLVKSYNKQINVDLVLMGDIASYVKRILKVFGVNFDEINLEKYLNGQSREGNLATNGPSNNEEVVMKYVDAMAQFRAEIRRISKGQDPQQSVRQILALCDNLRDQTLPNLGVRLEDKEVDGTSYAVKLVDAEILAKEKTLIEKRELEKKLKAETQRLEKLRLQQEREEKAKVPPTEMFKSQTDKYSKFDEKGMPTHDLEGREISKSALKKLQRLYAEQEARYTRYVQGMQ